MSLCVDVVPESPVPVPEYNGRGSLGERVRHRLTQSPYPALRRIRVEERYGVITLLGIVSNFHHKQVAQAAAAKVEGVKRIVNRIEVLEPAY